MSDSNEQAPQEVARRRTPHRAATRRRIAAPVAAFVPLIFLPTAAAAINITLVRYNPPGPDTGSNASLDQEYVTIHNDGRLTKVLTGWRLDDQSHHRFTFPAFLLCGHCSVRIHTGSGTNSTANLYWGSGATSGTTPATRRRSSSQPA